MTALIDSGFLYATLDADDKNHKRCRDALANLTDDLLLPTVVLVEVTYLLHARVGHKAMRRFIHQLESSPIPLTTIIQDDMKRIDAILDQYADAKLDFVDATIVALAERLDISRILTVDQRDFQIIRPKHCDYFEILP